MDQTRTKGRWNANVAEQARDNLKWRILSGEFKPNQTVKAMLRNVKAGDGISGGAEYGSRLIVKNLWKNIASYAR